MINHVFISAVQVYDLSYIHLQEVFHSHSKNVNQICTVTLRKFLDFLWSLLEAKEQNNTISLYCVANIWNLSNGLTKKLKENVQPEGFVNFQGKLLLQGEAETPTKKVKKKL